MIEFGDEGWVLGMLLALPLWVLLPACCPLWSAGCRIHSKALAATAAAGKIMYHSRLAHVVFVQVGVLVRVGWWVGGRHGRCR